MHKRDSLITGRYELSAFEPVAGEFFTTARQANLVAYPLERDGVVPRQPAAGR